MVPSPAPALPISTASAPCTFPGESRGHRDLPATASPWLGSSRGPAAPDPKHAGKMGILEMPSTASRCQQAQGDRAGQELPGAHSCREPFLQSKLALTEPSRGSGVLLAVIKPRLTPQTPQHLEPHPYFSEVPDSIKAKRAILLLLKKQIEKVFMKKTPN